MSNDLNLCQFIGRAGRDAEVRYMPSGEAVANISIGVGWKSKDKEGTEWVRCNAFGKLAEIVGQYVKKGKQVYVAGRFSTRKWTDKDGVERYSTEINLDRLQLLGGGDGKPDEQGKPRGSKQTDDFDDDPIPF